MTVKWTTRVIGVLGVVLGAAGVGASLLALVAVWNVRARIDTTIANTFDRVDVVLTRLAKRAQQTNQRIQGARDAVRDLNERVQQRVAELRDVPEEEALHLEGIERELYAATQQVKDWTAFMQATVELIEQLLEMMESTSAFLKDDSHTALDVVHSLRQGNVELIETSKLVASVEHRLSELRAGGNIEQRAAQIESLSSRIRGSLDKVQRFGIECETAVIAARSRIGELGGRIRRRIAIGAVLGTLLLLWIAVAQLSLALLGRRIWQSRATRCAIT